MVANDNDGLWTAIYVAAECFRYKVTGDAEARTNARHGMDALVRLESVTGIPGFPARSFVKTGRRRGRTKANGTTHLMASGGGRGIQAQTRSSATSSPTRSTHDLLADESEKPALRAALDRIMTHILDNDYRLLGFAGQADAVGMVGARRDLEDPDETGLRALHMLSHLRVARAHGRRCGAPRALPGGLQGPG